MEASGSRSRTWIQSPKEATSVAPSGTTAWAAGRSVCAGALSPWTVDHQLEAVLSRPVGEQFADRVPLRATTVTHEVSKHLRAHAPAIGPLDQRLR